jgi:capsular exopolysaccharide synthesis family protein
VTQPAQPLAQPPADAGVRVVLDQLRAIWKHRWLVITVAAAFTAVVALWTLRQPKIYDAAVTVEFDPNPPRPLGQHIDDVSSGAEGYWSTREFYTTQYSVIQSERVAEGVVRQLGLQHDPDFLGVPAQARRSFRSVPITAAAGALRGRMRVEPVRESRLVVIHVEDTNPRRAQLLANTIAAVYIRQNLEQKLSTTVSALEWLGQQLETLRGQVEDSERALYDYRRANNLMSVGFEDQRSHVGNRIQRLSEALTEAQTRRIGIAARVAALRVAAHSADPLNQQAPELLASSLLQGLRGQYETARRDRDSLATRYGRNAPQMLADESRLAEISDAVHHEVQYIVGAAENELRTARHVETDMRAALTDAQREALDLNLREIQYGRLARERENNVKLYNIVLERTRETDLTRLLRVNNVRVLDDALMPGAPVKPNMRNSLVAGALIGLLLGVALTFLLIQADRTVRSQADVEGELRATFLGLLPKIQNRQLRNRYRYQYGQPTDEGPVTNHDLIVHTHPNSAVAEACRVIRTNLLFMSPDEPFQSLMVVSANPREGKTVVAVSLAITLAQSGKRVLLIDTDMRRPRVHRVFRMRPPVGITSVLVNEVSLDDAVVETEVPNLWILPCGPIPPNPSELLHSHRFQELLKQARAKFERVVFDTPPVGAVTDALVIGPQIDGAVLVARGRKTVRARAAAVLNQMRGLGVRVAGVVLNDVDLRKEGGVTYYYGGSYEYQPQKNEAA